MGEREYNKNWEVVRNDSYRAVRFDGFVRTPTKLTVGVPRC